MTFNRRPVRVWRLGLGSLFGLAVWLGMTNPVVPGETLLHAQFVEREPAT